MSKPTSHPSRLQHSPSLPNIWIPPHSGPTLNDMNPSDKQGPSAPSSPKPLVSMKQNVKPEARSRHVKYASIDPAYRKIVSSSSKTHARRRTDRDQPHSLLTPPLTPSSSIRTTASRDSAPECVEAPYQEPAKEHHISHQDQEDQVHTSEELPEDDPHASRIVLINNLCKTLDPTTFESAIHEVLTGSNAASASKAIQLKRDERAIRAINCRDLASEGTVPVVFFDIRAAKVLKDLVEDVNHTYLHDTLMKESGKRLAARFVTVDELSKKLGSSPFLEKIDGSFQLTVQKSTSAQQRSGVQELEQEMEKTSISSEETSSRFRGSINGAILHSLLKSFGNLRHFVFERRVANEDDSTSLIYHVEYHDSRDADRAYNELHGHTLFGMKLHILGHFENKAPALPLVSSTDDIQFPNISTTGPETEENLSIGHAGSQSLMRARFKYSTLDGNQSQVPTATEAETQSDTASQHSTLQVNSVPNGAPSPTFFYTSAFVDATGNIHPHGTYRSTVDDGLELVATDATPTTQQLPELQERQWDDQAIYHHVDNNLTAPCYNPDGSCLYCPSRGYHTQHGANAYAGTHTPQGTGSLAHFGLSPAPTPPSISMYYPHPPPPPPTVSPNSASGMISAAAAAPPPHAGMGVLGGGYEYLDQQMHRASVNAQTPAAPWVSPTPFELAMSAGLAPTPTGMMPVPMGMNMNMNVGINMNMSGSSLGLPTSPAYFMRGDETPSSGRMYHHHHHHHHGYLRPDAMQHPHAMNEGSSPLMTCIPSSMRGSRRGSATGVAGAGSTPRSSPPPGRRSSSRLQRPKDVDNNNHNKTPKASPPPQISSSSPSLGTSPLNDRNQLNIARIEEGLDTRTTVMIKNIPNKMSDRDLVTYIDRVCPRRIDFFYLRMDFQNGCNVGYAFVNFIHVQDLLRFAKARLGVKWNMFSSEKVLQMSYANYQGKEALVEKFKNSAIMDERESWRPRIFYSSGPPDQQGLPEPFPPPTHMRRKERSSYNRGALFVPGGSGIMNGHASGVAAGAAASGGSHLGRDLAAGGFATHPRGSLHRRVQAGGASGGRPPREAGHKRGNGNWVAEGLEAQYHDERPTMYRSSALKTSR